MNSAVLYYLRFEMRYPHSRLTILGSKGAKFLISPKFYSPDPVYSLNGFGGRDSRQTPVMAYMGIYTLRSVDSDNAYILLRVLFYFGGAYRPLHCTIFLSQLVISMGGPRHNISR